MTASWGTTRMKLACWIGSTSTIPRTSPGGSVIERVPFFLPGSPVSSILYDMSSKSREKRAKKRQEKQFDFKTFVKHVKTHVDSIDAPAEVLDQLGDKVLAYKLQAQKEGVPARMVSLNAFRILQGKDPLPYRGTVRPVFKMRSKLRRG